MARKRNRAGEYERTKAMRRIEKMKITLETASHSVARILKARIEQYQNAIEATRMYSKETGKKVRDSKEIARNVAALKELNENMPLAGRDIKSRRIRYEQQNKMTQNLINMASSEKVQGVTPYTKGQVQAFYRATQRAWENAPIDKRNEAILKYYHVSSLKDLFETITGEKEIQGISWALDLLRTGVNPDTGEKATDDEKAQAQVILSIKDNQDLQRYSITKVEIANISPEAPGKL